MRPWHDFYIDGSRREFAFDLVWPCDAPTDARRAWVVFEGVEPYFLEHDLGSNIVYDFAEGPLRGFLEEWTQRFKLSAKCGWLAFWRPPPVPQRPVEVDPSNPKWLPLNRVEVTQWLLRGPRKAQMELPSGYAKGLQSMNSKDNEILVFTRGS